MGEHPLTVVGVLFILAGVLLGAYLKGYDTGYKDEGHKTYTSIAECEKTLARNVNCKLVAIVDYGETK